MSSADAITFWLASASIGLALASIALVLVTFYLNRSIFK